jgi:hypothetical protein
MGTPYGDEQQFRQFLAVNLAGVILGFQIAQGFAHDFVSICIVAIPDLFRNEGFEFFAECHLHGAIVPEALPAVNCLRLNRTYF